MALPPDISEPQFGVQGEYFVYYDQVGRRRVLSGDSVSGGTMSSGTDLERRGDDLYYRDANGTERKVDDVGSKEISTDPFSHVTTIASDSIRFWWWDGTDRIGFEGDYDRKIRTLTASASSDGENITIGWNADRIVYLDRTFDLFRREATEAGWTLIASNITGAQGNVYEDSPPEGQYEYRVEETRINSNGTSITDEVITEVAEIDDPCVPPEDPPQNIDISLATLLEPVALSVTWDNPGILPDYYEIFVTVSDSEGTSSGGPLSPGSEAWQTPENHGLQGPWSATVQYSTPCGTISETYSSDEVSVDRTFTPSGGTYSDATTVEVKTTANNYQNDVRHIYERRLNAGSFIEVHNEVVASGVEVTDDITLTQGTQDRDWRIRLRFEDASSGEEIHDSISEDYIIEKEETTPVSHDVTYTPNGGTLADGASVEIQCSASGGGGGYSHTIERQLNGGVWNPIDTKTGSFFSDFYNNVMTSDGDTMRFRVTTESSGDSVTTTSFEYSYDGGGGFQ